MTAITLRSPKDYPLTPLIRSALGSELRRLKASLKYSQMRLAEFEAKYQMPTEEFVRRYARNEVAETLETIEWLGEHRMARDIEQQIETLQAVEFDR